MAAYSPVETGLCTYIALPSQEGDTKVEATSAAIIGGAPYVLPRCDMNREVDTSNLHEYEIHSIPSHSIHSIPCNMFPFVRP